MCYLKKKPYLCSTKHKRYKDMESYYKDYYKGVEDCKVGIYDKWYRYHHSFDGYAYNDGWTAQNSITQNESVRFIECAL